jgi:cyclic-di-AMP phosphodiesterase PgpH
VRATRDHSPQVIDRVIRESISSQIADGQMTECDLTLRDLDRIREAFGSVLQGVYHPRIAYPALPGAATPADAAPTEAAAGAHPDEAAAAAPSRPRRRQRASAHDRERP